MTEQLDKVHPNSDDQYPSNFAEMLDTENGTLIQRATKIWIKPRNPKGTIRLMKQLQVDKFQAIPIGFAQRMIKNASVDNPFQSNYTLGRPDLNSMVDFATNQNTFNEGVHLLGMSWCILWILPPIAAGRADAITLFIFGTFMINTYCVLAQRYSRARLSLSIDRALARRKKFNSQSYINSLGIKLPPDTE